MIEKQLYIIRHGETDLNKRKIIQGQGMDAPLNGKGRAQGRAFYEYYKSEDFDVVLTSKLIRTQQTVALFIKQGLPTEQFAEIDEINWGVHEGQKPSLKLKRVYMKLIENWQNGNLDAHPKEGESAAQLANRLSQFVEHLKTRTEKKILICSHGRAMRCLMCVLKNQDLKEMENYEHSNTGLYKINFSNGEFSFELENDTKHLDE